MAPQPGAEVVAQLALGERRRGGARHAGAAGPACGAVAAFAAVRVGGSLVLASAQDLAPRSALEAPAEADLGGVSCSPDGAWLAAWSSDDLFLCRVRSPAAVGALAHAGQLPGLRSLAWCPRSCALAACCKQELAVLPLPPLRGGAGGGGAGAGGGEPPAPLQRLPGPRGAAAGPRCAAWLPRPRADAPPGVLAAWGSELLLFTWPQGAGGVDWRRRSVQRILPGWHGPVRALAAAWDASSAGCVVLATVDAQLDLGSGGGDESNAVLLMPGSGSGNARRGLISELPGASPPAGSGSSSREGSPTQARRSGASPPHGVRPPRAGVRLSPGGGAEAAGALAPQPGVLGSLLSIGGAAEPDAEHRTPRLIADLSPPRGARDATSGSASASANASASASARMHLLRLGDAQAGSPAAAALALPRLPLPDLLVVHEASGLAAVASSAASPPLVALISVGGAAGLELLATVTLPLPRGVADPGATRARVEGLALVAAGANPNAPAPSGRAAEGSVAGRGGLQAFPVVGEGGFGGVSAPAAAAAAAGGGGGAPDVVALLSCCPAARAGEFAGFGSSRGGAAEEFLVRCRLALELAGGAQPPQQDQAAHAAVDDGDDGDADRAASQDPGESIWWRGLTQRPRSPGAALPARAAALAEQTAALEARQREQEERMRQAQAKVLSELEAECAQLAARRAATPQRRAVGAAQAACAGSGAGSPSSADVSPIAPGVQGLAALAAGGSTAASAAAATAAADAQAARIERVAAALSGLQARIEARQAAGGGATTPAPATPAPASAPRSPVRQALLAGSAAQESAAAAGAMLAGLRATLDALLAQQAAAAGRWAVGGQGADDALAAAVSTLRESLEHSSSSAMAPKLVAAKAAVRALRAAAKKALKALRDATSLKARLEQRQRKAKQTKAAHPDHPPAAQEQVDAQVDVQEQALAAPKGHQPLRADADTTCFDNAPDVDTAQVAAVAAAPGGGVDASAVLVAAEEVLRPAAQLPTITTPVSNAAAARAAATSSPDVTVCGASEAPAAAAAAPGGDVDAPCAELVGAQEQVLPHAAQLPAINTAVSNAAAARLAPPSYLGAAKRGESSSPLQPRTPARGSDEDLALRGARMRTDCRFGSMGARVDDCWVGVKTWSHAH
ncbi:hypothetical protein HT031_003690 [Scenedesmus sp. PABB004]|nr:hypothetical protein HT031_003690 [Scenedesmus sp. PABB004]